MDRLRQDLRYAVASWRQRPGFTATVVAITALGIGANAAMFALLNATLIRPLDIPQAERLVQVFEVNEERGQDTSNVAFPNAMDLAARSDAIERLGMFTPVDRNLNFGEHPERVRAALASPGLFDVVGIQAVRGRLFVDGDIDGAPIVLLAESYWRSRLGGDDEVIGSTVAVNGTPAHIAGVVSDRPEIGEFEIYQPLPRVDYVTTRSNHFLTAFARLGPATGLDQAQAEATEVGRSLQAARPETNAGWNFHLVPMQQSLVGQSSTVLMLFFAGVAAVLVIACLNVTNLMLVRGSERTREIAVREALGASRGRLVRQLITESLVLSGVGGVVGTGIAYAGLGALRNSLPGGIPGLREATIDLNVLGFAVVVSILTGILFGTAPALRTVAGDAVQGLRDGGNAVASGHRSRARHLLVVVELTAAVLLLAVAATLVQSLVVALARDPGFRSDGVITTRLEPPADAYPREALPQFVDALLDEVESVPGVERAAVTTRIPLGRSETWRGYKAAGAPDPGFEAGFWATWLSTTPGYLETIGIELTAGRDFSAADLADSEPVMLVNETLARRVFGRVDIVGEQIHIWTDEALPRTVVGVVANPRNRTLFGEEVPAEYYTPFAQSPASRISVVVAAAGDDVDVVPSLRAALLTIDDQLPLFDVRTMRAVIADDTATQATASRLLGLLAALALGLAVFGLYGVVAYATSRRGREIGVRLALGADRSAIQRLVVRQGVLTGAIGTALGMGLAAATIRLLASMVPNLDPAGPGVGVWIAIAAIALGTTAAAAFVPARRASRIDPLRSLGET